MPWIQRIRKKKYKSRLKKYYTFEKLKEIYYYKKDPYERTYIRPTK